MIQGLCFYSNKKRTVSLLGGQETVLYFVMAKIDKNVIRGNSKPPDSFYLEAPESGSLASDVHNKGTFLHFSTENKGDSSNRRAFMFKRARCRNLTIGNALHRSSYISDPIIQKIQKNLLCCCSYSMVGVDGMDNAQISTTSQKCDSRHCAICSRRKSARLVNRLMNVITDPQNKVLFENKYWYFITFTQTKKGSAEDMLLKLKDSLKRFYRSKAWNAYFGKIGKSNTAGWITSIENSIKTNGHHIHAHVLVCGDRLNKKVMDVQSELRDTWLKITKDSTGVQLDLLKDVQDVEIVDGVSCLKVNQKKLYKVVQETLGYQEKTQTFDSLSDKEIDYLAEWMIVSKHTNTTNVRGFLRGFKLTGKKSDYDTEYKVKEIDENLKYHVGKTTSVVFNFKSNTSYPKRFRNFILSNVFIKSIYDFLDVGGDAKDFQFYLKNYYFDKELFESVKMDMVAKNVEDGQEQELGDVVMVDVEIDDRQLELPLIWDDPSEGMPTGREVEEQYFLDAW